MVMPFSWGSFESVRDLARVVESGLDRKRSLEGLALDQLHDQRALLQPVDLRNVRMLSEPAPWLALEACEPFGDLVRVRREEP